MLGQQLQLEIHYLAVLLQLINESLTVGHVLVVRQRVACDHLFLRIELEHLNHRRVHILNLTPDVASEDTDRRILDEILVHLLRRREGALQFGPPRKILLKQGRA